MTTYLPTNWAAASGGARAQSAFRVGPPAWSPERGWHGDSKSYVVGECSGEEYERLMTAGATPPATEPSAEP